MIEWIPLENLINNDRNPRSIKREAFNKLIENIKDDPEFLECRPILVYAEDVLSQKFIIYAGNQRYRAIKQLKWPKAPCIISKDLDDAKRKKRAILDNVSAGEWDYDILAADYELEDLLKMGIDEKLLDMQDVEVIVKEKEDKPAQEHECPMCGHKF